MTGDGYQTRPFDVRRRAIVDAMRMAHERNDVHGIAEFDVTEARRRIREHEAATGERLSFTAFVVACFARAIAEQPSVQAYRDWRGNLVVFDDVDVSVLVETTAHGEPIALPHVIRRADRRPVRSISAEIRRVQRGDDPGVQSPLVPLLLRLPGVVRRQLYRLPRLFPHRWKRLAGTVAVSSVGMFGSGGGWGITPTNYTLQLTVGGIAERPAYVDGDGSEDADEGELRRREFLSLTVTADHDVVDGAPLARFGRHLRELVESAEGLPEHDAVDA